jgi:hypothetical protein
MEIELLTKFAEFLTEQVTDMNRPIIADFLEKFLVVEIKKMESPEPVEEPIVAEVSKEARRSGNGHKIMKVRDLNDSEKNGIRSFFLDRNGCIENDACVEYKKHLDVEVAIFQVTGFVTYLHKCIAMGRWTVTNMASYLTFLRGHRNLWATYDSPKYRAMRAKLEVADPTAGVELKTEPDPSSTKDVSAAVEAVA